ncbi:DNA-binding protein P3A2-like isoform X2 [Xenia sp. Carnegie-2017]|nr:DNA-binding protein P3A2-like isoform X2 [Xenia sp. Carnegie-2017]
MAHVGHVVSMHHDGSHSPEIVTMHETADHFQNIPQDTSTMSEPSSPESATFDDSDLLNSSVTDVVTNQLAAAGPIGVAAAAAVATGRKRKRPHSFETNPSIRKRQQTRLLRKLKGTVDEYATRVGQQAVVVCACPGRPNPLFKVFGAAPLENCVKSLKPHILQSLEAALAQQTPTPSQDNTGLHELPPLYIDGIPTPVDKMTQAQLRAFIPLMLKYSTGRGKPGWGRDATKPPWWPGEIPWQNVRSDTRSEEQKAKLSWTNALKMIVKNCYEYHGRSDLLPDFQDADAFSGVQSTHPIVHTLTNADGTLSLVQVDANGAIVGSYTDNSTQAESTQAVATLSEVSATTQGAPVSISISEMSQGEAAAQAAVATLAEATLSDGGQLVIPEHTASALASVGNSALNTSTMVTIPVHAAAAMMQIQNNQLGNGQTQYITTSVPQVAMAPHTNLHTVNSAQNIQTQLAESSGSENTVPGASQAVEVVTYSS